MITHFLGEEQVDAYLRDLATRLPGLPNFPNVWCPIGWSGVVLLRRLIRFAPSIDADGKAIPVHHNRDEKSIKLDAADPKNDVGGTHVCILDSSIHSGSTMLQAARVVQALEPATLTTYSLVVKRSSVFVPTFWGVTIDDHDRAYFLLNELPNNRLEAKKVPHCHLRLLRLEDLGSPLIRSGLGSLDHVSWADRLYDMRCSVSERRTYLLEVGCVVVGYLTFTIRSDDRGGVLTVDEVAVEKDLQNTNHCSTMLRYAETVARHARCYEIRLWAIEDRIPMYEHIKFIKTAGVEVMDLGTEKYTHMHRKVVYHIRLPGSL